MAKDDDPAASIRLSHLFEKAMKDLNLVGTGTWHRRGHYFTKIFGISFGGGQQRLGNFAHSRNEERVWDALRNTPEVRAVARRVDFTWHTLLSGTQRLLSFL